MGNEWDLWNEWKFNRLFISFHLVVSTKSILDHIYIKKWSESCSVVSNSLWPHGLYSPWNSPGQNTGVGSFSLLQGIFPPRDQTQVSCIVGRFFTSWATRGAQEYWSGKPTPSPADLSDPGTEPGSPASQVDSLPTELSGKPKRGLLSSNSNCKNPGSVAHWLSLAPDQSLNWLL